MISADCSDSFASMCPCIYYTHLNVIYHTCIQRKFWVERSVQYIYKHPVHLQYHHFTATKCDPRCEKFGQGKCLPDGQCLCWWGWTGPNATYITSGSLKNRIVVRQQTVQHQPFNYRK